jgi:membrane-associated phospholipid phosphatase
VRALAPFVAGSSGLAYKRFIPFSIVGTGLWGTTFCVLGYVFWQSFDQVASIAGHAVLGFGITAGVIVGVVVAYRRLRRPEERQKLAAWLDRQGQRPLPRPLFAVARPVWRRVLRPIGRVVGPQVRFLWGRITPGELGLQLTTALAVGGVGIYFFVLFTMVLSSDPGPTVLDAQWFDLMDKLRTPTGVDIARVVSGLGALPTVLGLVLGTAIMLATRRRPIDLVTLLLAFGLIVLGVHVAKAGIDRPRPDGTLVEFTGSSYPSGHAAYSATWVAAAVLFTRRQGLASQATRVMAAVVISAAIGVSRIYLHVHFWSDVAGGWGLGYGVFGFAAVVALVIARVRHNEGAVSPSDR